MTRQTEHAENAPRSALRPGKQPYGWAWLLSLGLHFSLFGVIIGAAMLDACGAPEPETTPMAAKLVRLGTPRDPRMLPRLPTAPPVPPAAQQAPQAQPGRELNRPPPPEPEPAPRPPPPPESAPPKPSPAPTPSPAPAAPPRQATAPANAPQDPGANLDDILQRFAADARAGKAEPLPGQPDGDPEGDAEEAEEGERYLALLRRRLHEHFLLPSTIPAQERVRLFADIRVQIQPNGTITSVDFVRRSGNPQFDAALEAAVLRASPVPPPPSHLLRSFPNGLSIRYRP